MEKKVNFDRVLQAVVRSMVRVKILVFLASHQSEGFNHVEIAYRIRSSPDNVLGALMGWGKRYNKALSLVDLGLVSLVEKQPGTKIYNITAEGIEFARRLKYDNPDTPALLSFICIEEDGNSILRSRLDLGHKL